MFRQILGRNVEGPRGVRLLLGYVDAADPGVVHADVSHDVAASIRHRYVHRLPDLASLLFRCRDYSARIRQCNHPYSPCDPDWYCVGLSRSLLGLSNYTSSTLGRTVVLKG